jgi:hypothetical protein
MFDGRERDGVFETEEAINFVEAIKAQLSLYAEAEITVVVGDARE